MWLLNFPKIHVCFFRDNLRFRFSGPEHKNSVFMVLCTKSLIFFSLSSLFKFLKCSTSSVGFWVSFTLLTLLSIWRTCEPHSQRPPLTTTHPTAATTMTTSRTPMKTHMVFHRFVLASSSCQTGTFTCNHCQSWWWHCPWILKTGLIY